MGNFFKGHDLCLVLQGHLHVNEVVKWNKTTFIMGGAISGSWWNGSNQGTAEGFGLINWEEGSPTWDYTDYGWSALHPKDSP
ncbi:MAG: hypothetical protein AAGA18_00605 [Verrucomicrobiota bacterium]